MRYGILLYDLGRLPEAISEAEKAIGLDPVFSRAWDFLGLSLIASRQLPEARKALHRAIEISPEDRLPRWRLAFISLLEGNPQDALQGFARIEDLAGRAMAEHDLGHAKDSQQALDELIAKRASTFPTEIAWVYAWRGEKDRAFARSGGPCGSCDCGDSISPADGGCWLRRESAVQPISRCRGAFAKRAVFGGDMVLLTQTKIGAFPPGAEYDFATKNSRLGLAVPAKGAT